MRGNGFFGSTLPVLVGLATALMVGGPLHAEDAASIVTAKGGTSAADTSVNTQRQRARVASEEGHDGAGYFDRGIRVRLGRGDQGHDGSGRFEHPAQPDGGWRLEQNGAENVTLR